MLNLTISETLNSRYILRTPQNFCMGFKYGQLYQMARTCSFSHDNGFFKLRTCAYAQSSQVDPTVNILLRVGTVSVGRVVGLETRPGQGSVTSVGLWLKYRQWSANGAANLPAPAQPPPH